MTQRSLMMFGVLLICAGASATTLQVPAQFPTIQAALGAANSGDTVLVADGVYAGVGNKDLDYGGRPIVLLSVGGPDNCTIDCRGSGRGVYFHSGETATAQINGFRIINGAATNGGGIYVSNSSPTISRCIIWGCAAPGSAGGGIYVNNGAPLIQNCTLSQNTAGHGGAIYAVNSNLVVNSCIITDNASAG